MTLKRTALYSEHVSLKARLIDFGGWEMPVQYTGLMEEHLACRNSAGLFDVSHMGEAEVSGPAALRFLNQLVTNDVSALAVGQAQYTAMCNFEGGIVDDLVIYRRALDRFLLVINAGNTSKDLAWMEARLSDFRSANPDAEVALADLSDEFSQLALQGRNAAALLETLKPKVELRAIKTYWFAETSLLDGIKAIIARTGYTGEDGFEIYLPWGDAPAVWRALLAAGQPLGLKACGLGARDTLRTEMKYPLYGNELTDQTSPLEAGLGWVTKFSKGSFVGSAPLLRMKEAGVERKLIGFKTLDRNIPRSGYEIWDSEGGQPIGTVTSGTHSPSLGHPIGIGYVSRALGDVGSRITILIRGQKIPAEIVQTPFYKRPY
jgi:aminomethyltransferase